MSRIFGNIWLLNWIEFLRKSQIGGQFLYFPPSRLFRFCRCTIWLDLAKKRMWATALIPIKPSLPESFLWRKTTCPCASGAPGPVSFKAEGTPPFKFQPSSRIFDAFAKYIHLLEIIDRFSCSQIRNELFPSTTIWRYPNLSMQSPFSPEFSRQFLILLISIIQYSPKSFPTSQNGPYFLNFFFWEIFNESVFTDAVAKKK